MRVVIGRWALTASRIETGEHNGTRLLVRTNGGLKMTRGKAAAQAIHAALYAVDAHPHVPVIVLNGTKADIEAMPFRVHDAGHTEVDPGTLTAGAAWVGDERV